MTILQLDLVVNITVANYRWDIVWLSSFGRSQEKNWQQRERMHVLQTRHYEQEKSSHVTYILNPLKEN